MNQLFLHYHGPDDQLRKLKDRLAAEGFAVGPTKRTVGGIIVRIREETGDRSLVERIACQVAPGAKQGPPSGADKYIEGYREGRD